MNRRGMWPKKMTYKKLIVKSFCKSCAGRLSQIKVKMYCDFFLHGSANIFAHPYTVHTTGESCLIRKNTKRGRRGVLAQFYILHV